MINVALIGRASNCDFEGAGSNPVVYHSFFNKFFDNLFHWKKQIKGKVEQSGSLPGS